MRRSIVLSLFYQVYYQGLRTKGVVLTSSYEPVQISCFSHQNYNFLFYKTTYLNDEVNCTENSPSVRVPWPDHCVETQL